MNVGDKFRVKQSLWTGRIEIINANGAIIHARMDMDIGEPDSRYLYSFYASDIEIIEDNIFNPDFTLDSRRN